MTQSTPIFHRRSILLAAAATGLIAATPSIAASPEAAFALSPFRKLSDNEWKQRLPNAAYGVLRHEDTEYPFTSPMLNEHRKGTFACLACDLPLFKSEWKYDSGTGWPSFFRGDNSNIGQKSDFKAIAERTEYHCARCLGHMGHVFNDGPPPTGLRYCNNGVALKFIPA